MKLLATPAIMALIAVLILSGCQPRIDLEREKEALIQVDKDFAAMSAKDGYIEAYYRYLVDDAILLPPDADIKAGRERIYKEDTELGLLGLLEWEPEDADVARSCDLGWTWGRWVFTVKDEQGNPEESYGKYLFIWKKIDGQWKVVANIWNDNPQPQ